MLQEKRARKDKMADQELKALREIRVLKDPADQRVRKAELVLQVPRDRMVVLVRQEPLVLLALPGHLVHQEV